MADFFHDAQLGGVRGAVALQGNAQQEVAVLGHDVHQHRDYLRRRLIPVLVVDVLVVVPAADAGAGLPGKLLDGVGCAALHVPEDGLFLPGCQYLACKDHVVPAVVAVGQDLQTGIGDGP